MKTKGYHFEHNHGHGHGHGQQQAPSALASPIILAVLVHAVLERMDDQHRPPRRKPPSRQRLSGDIRTLTGRLRFESWGALMAFAPHGFEPAPPQAPPQPKTG